MVKNSKYALISVILAIMVIATVLLILLITNNLMRRPATQNNTRANGTVTSPNIAATPPANQPLRCGPGYSCMSMAELAALTGLNSSVLSNYSAAYSPVSKTASNTINMTSDILASNNATYVWTVWANYHPSAQASGNSNANQIKSLQLLPVEYVYASRNAKGL